MRALRNTRLPRDSSTCLGLSPTNSTRRLARTARLIVTSLLFLHHTDSQQLLLEAGDISLQLGRVQCAMNLTKAFFVALLHIRRSQHALVRSRWLVINLLHSAADPLFTDQLHSRQKVVRIQPQIAIQLV